MADRTTYHQVLGCDVGKDSIVIFDSLSGTTHSLDNRPVALRRVLGELACEPANGVLLVCEATGGHEAGLLSLALQAGLAAHRADPRKARAFINSLRSQGKSDAIDAEGLTRYGLERGDRLPLWQPPSQSQQALQGLVRLRADLTDCRADYRRRLKAPGQGPDKDHIRAFIEDLNQRIKTLEADIKRRISQDAGLAETCSVIDDIPSCGAKTAITLAVLMPELGQINRRQAAALSGYAPHPNQSGKSDAYRRVRGGRREIKKALFMAALSASRFHPELKRNYQSLIARGKKPIVAISAIARKLITIINAKLRDARISQQQLC